MTSPRRNTRHHNIHGVRAALCAAALSVALLSAPATLYAETANAGEAVAQKESAYKVKLFKSFLSVSAQEAAFGDIMAEVAGKVGFELIISPDIAEKTLTTNFSDVEVQRGIQRLLALINHKNYFMHYGREGNIKKLEIYGAVSPSAPGSLPMPPAPGDETPAAGPMAPRESVPELADDTTMPPGMQLGEIESPQGAMIENEPSASPSQELAQEDARQALPEAPAAPAEEAKLTPTPKVKHPYLKPAQMPEQLPEIKRF